MAQLQHVAALCAGRIIRKYHNINMVDDPRLNFALRFVRRRCPQLDDAEAVDAAHNFLEYLDVVRKIYERTKTEQRTIDVVEPRNR